MEVADVEDVADMIRILAPDFRDCLLNVAQNHVMRTQGLDEWVTRVQQMLALPTKKQAEKALDAVVVALEATLLNNLDTDGFTLKLGSFGESSVGHKPGILRKIPFTGNTILTRDRRKVRFVSLGALRQSERVH